MVPRTCRRQGAHPTRTIDDVVHQRVRLGILTVAYEARRVDFNFLLDTLSLTGGNLSQHLRVLEDAGLVRVSKVIEGRKPRTWISITAKGRRALLQEVEALRAIVGRVRDPAAKPAKGAGSRPGSPSPAAVPVLASDVEREAAATVVSHAIGEGRLSLEEGEARIDAVYQARDRLRLGDLIADLPVIAPQPGTALLAVPLQSVALICATSVVGAAAVLQGFAGLWELWPVAAATGVACSLARPRRG